YPMAIEDFNKAIKLAPNSANAYNNRGLAYFMQGNDKKGCSDVQKACSLGFCKALELTKSRGACH
ncbi:MAG TPA: tetratricopeptide repeat protein, partial [Smithella sp.]|nr:tetratricopeptide repeat protein [Smithella sp.]